MWNDQELQHEILLDYIYCFAFINPFFAYLAWDKERLSKNIFKQQYNINKLMKE